MCNHCPYVKHVAAGLAELAKEYQRRGVAVVGINANDATSYPDDSPAKMAEEVEASRLHLPLSLRRDSGDGQGVSGGLHARLLPLRSQAASWSTAARWIRAGRGSDIPVTGGDLRAALDAVLAGQPVSADQKPSIGCNIKWKPGNEPDYFG